MCQKSPENEKDIIFKTNHIIDCFINNRLLPRVRIDIPDELACYIVDQKDYTSPYLFLDSSVNQTFIMMSNKIVSLYDLYI